MKWNRKVLAVATVVGLVTVGGGVAVASAGDGDEQPAGPVEAPAVPDQLPDEVMIVDGNGAIVRNPDGTPRMHSTANPPLATPTAPDVTYPDPPGEQQVDVEAPLVADQD